MLYIGKESKLMVPVEWAVAIVGSFVLTVFAIGAWCASISFKLDATAAESAKVSLVENRLTRIETILTVQFPNAAKIANEKLVQ
jgi:hypothetical protein